eukprot:2935438-Rhodomonas_salina.1
MIAGISGAGARPNQMRFPPCRYCAVPELPGLHLISLRRAVFAFDFAAATPVQCGARFPLSAMRSAPLSATRLSGTDG